MPKTSSRTVAKKGASNGSEASRNADEFLMQEVSISKIHHSPLNKEIPLDDIDRLAQNIEQVGLLHEIAVYALEDGTYEIISGHRRFEAMKKLGKKKIRCQVRPYETDARKRFLLHFNANSQTRDKDVRFKIAEFHTALDLVKKDGAYKSSTDLMKAASMLLSENNSGYSLPQLYRIQAVERMTDEMKALDRFGISINTIALARSLPDHLQRELARRVEEKCTESLQDGREDKAKEFTRNDFASLVKQIRLENGIEEEVPKAKAVHRSYASKLREAKGAYQRAFSVDNAHSVEEKRIAIQELKSMKEELDQMIHAFQQSM